ncbi:MAG: fibronectin type III domain-containing protein [Candidatus Thiodiazotropha sp.]
MDSHLRSVLFALAITIFFAGCGSSSNGDNSGTDQLQPPTISLSANPATVLSGDSTILSWVSHNADSCTASGDWSRSKDLTGSETIDSLTTDSHFVLSCTNSSGTTTESIDVVITMSGNGTALVSWTPPTENTDGSVLTDLAGYKIYYGATSNNYTEVVSIDNPGLSSYQINNLTAADWYFVVTAVNSSDVESSFSNEVSKTID